MAFKSQNYYKFPIIDSFSYLLVGVILSRESKLKRLYLLFYYWVS